jgi:hypothetical protein
VLSLYATIYLLSKYDLISRSAVRRESIVRTNREVTSFESFGLAPRDLQGMKTNIILEFHYSNQSKMYPLLIYYWPFASDFSMQEPSSLRFQPTYSVSFLGAAKLGF